MSSKYLQNVSLHFQFPPPKHLEKCSLHFGYVPPLKWWRSCKYIYIIYIIYILYIYCIYIYILYIYIFIGHIILLLCSAPYPFSPPFGVKLPVALSASHFSAGSYEGGWHHRFATVSQVFLQQWPYAALLLWWHLWCVQPPRSLWLGSQIMASWEGYHLVSGHGKGEAGPVQPLLGTGTSCGMCLKMGNDTLLWQFVWVNYMIIQWV